MNKAEQLSEEDRKAIEQFLYDIWGSDWENVELRVGARKGAEFGILHARKEMINDNRSLLGLDVAAAVDAELWAQAERIAELERQNTELGRCLDQTNQLVRKYEERENRTTRGGCKAEGTE